MNSFYIIILDGVGVGELPDADIYGDLGSNTLSNMAQMVNGLNLPNLSLEWD
jgi:phosphopentomutase